MSERIGLRAWVRATWTGWILGVPLVIVLALMGEAVGIGGSQVLVGAGMGTGIGLGQSRAIRRVLPTGAPWFWSCALGLALPFLVTDIVLLVGGRNVFNLYMGVAAGGLIAGCWQAMLLRSRVRRAGWWVVASVLGWTLASATAAAADGLTGSQWLRGIWGALAYLGLVAGGGLILGMVTGVALIRLLRNDAESSPDRHDPAARAHHAG